MEKGSPMVFKPMEERSYRALLKAVNWRLEKGSIDYNLYDENGIFVCTIKIAHGKGAKKEVVAHSVHKTGQKFKERELQWPPKKK